MAPDPLQQRLMLLVFRIVDRFQKIVIAADAAAILGRSMELAIRADRIT